MSFSTRDTSSSSYSKYLIKSFGATLADLKFSRLPTVIEIAKLAIPDNEVVGSSLARLKGLRSLQD
jgi:hypothetical protein